MKNDLTRFGDLHLSISPAAPGCGYLLYVHGGPGGHGAFHERAVQEMTPLSRTGGGWICYDQRGCGRSALGAVPLSHETNVSDLAALYDYLQRDRKLTLDAVVGHSYGASLTYELFSRRPALTGRAVLVAFAPDRRLPRYRSLLMDLIALKIRQPETYRAIFAEMSSCPETPWEIASRARDAMTDTALRKYFYWANLETLAWYERTAKAHGVCESDEIFRRVRETIWASEAAMAPIDLTKLRVPVLAIHGYHDFLMGTDAHLGASEVFLFSGHYPHWEEPERFAKTLETFLAAFPNGKK